MKLVIAFVAIMAVLVVVRFLVLWSANREMDYPGIDDIDLDDPDVKAGR